MILVIDNYDSFTYNIVQFLAEMGAEVSVHRNDQITSDEMEAGLDQGKWKGLVISPGPGRPDEAGRSLDAIRLFAGRVPIFGVCLGLQCMGQLAGAQIVSAKQLMHGKVSKVHHDNRGVFKGLPNPLTATRYHSLAVDEAGLSSSAEVTARTDDGEIMGLRVDPSDLTNQASARRAPIEGVQFHPESILTQEGRQLIANFISMTETVG